MSGEKDKEIDLLEQKYNDLYDQFDQQQKFISGLGQLLDDYRDLSPHFQRIENAK